MRGSCLAKRLGRHLRLTNAEIEALDGLEEQDRLFRGGTVVLRENEPQHQLFVVRSGWLHSSAISNGKRQITRFYFPGEIVGLALLAFSDTPETVTVVTDAALCPFSREQLGKLVGGHPRLGALLLCVAVAGRVTMADRLVAIARASARARVGGLLCEIFSRMRQLDLVEDDGSIQLPLTQDDIADATGLHSVHVSRTMSALAKDGIIERRRNGQLQILDEKRLTSDANFVNRTGIETGWLPPAR